MSENAKGLIRRCPRLGSPVSFDYCQTCEPQGPVCWKILDCWWETFDVARYLQDTLSPEQFQRLAAAKAKPKITSLIEIAQRARRRLNDDENQCAAPETSL
jgi:hypothetical protein